MCGIVGLAGASDSALSAEAVWRMGASVARRGPDDEGYESWPGATLGHRRLSIFDLSTAGRQPMVTEDRAVAVTFNGAIYNFRELRRELEQCGSSFRSQSDTEVILRGYREWGIERLVERLQGMFAFALWDNRDRTLHLVRDRLGVKPLLYAARDGQIAFASSAQAFQALGWTGRLDDQALADFLEYGYVTEQRTVYAGISKLPAATVLKWKNGRCSQHRYWTAPEVDEQQRISFEQAVEETERLLLAAVRRRLVADVPVCALLSGGIDSSLVCWAIAELGADITAYTVATPGDPWDESSDARRTAEALGIRHRELNMTPDVAADVSTLVSAYGEPFACASALGMLDLSGEIKSNATVLLTGDGGDDAYLGYPEHLNLYTAQRLARFLPLSTSAWQRARRFVPRRGPLRRLVHLVDYAIGGIGAVAAAHEGLPELAADDMLGERLRGSSVDARRVAWSTQSGGQVLSDFLEHDRNGRFVAEYLTKVDGATMYHALEARSPFLDTELWEFAGRLPYGLRLRQRRLKAVLRELARRKLGDRVAFGKKKGFGVPVQRWIAGPWRDAVADAFRDSLLDREGFVSAPAVLRRLEASAKAGWTPNRVWYAYVLESWLRQERAGEPPAGSSAPRSLAVAAGHVVGQE
jgi:asparagine synthase (glutamine-hydrolysing)